MGNIMTVRDLIEKLQKMPQDATFMVQNYGGTPCNPEGPREYVVREDDVCDANHCEGMVGETIVYVRAANY